MSPESPLDATGIARRQFSTARRGYDQGEVRAFLNELSEAVARLQRHDAHEHDRAERAETRAHLAEQFDEHRLVEVLGEETARVLDAARAAARDIRSKAEESAARLVREAHAEARAISSQAEEQSAGRRAEILAEVDVLRREAEAEIERRRTEGQVVADDLRRHAEAERDRLLDGAKRARGDAEAAAEQIRASAREQGRRLVGEAQAVRERILADLARRRRAAREQLERLNGARERLLAAYEVVRRTVEAATAELTASLPEAKLAGELAMQRVSDEPAESIEMLEAELAVARMSGETDITAAEVTDEELDAMIQELATADASAAGELESAEGRPGDPDAAEEPAVQGAGGEGRGPRAGGEGPAVQGAGGEGPGPRAAAGEGLPGARGGEDRADAGAGGAGPGGGPAADARPGAGDAVAGTASGPPPERGGDASTGPLAGTPPEATGPAGAGGDPADQPPAGRVGGSPRPGREMTDAEKWGIRLPRSRSRRAARSAPDPAAAAGPGPATTPAADRGVAANGAGRAPGRDVDELFARIRAERSEGGAGGRGRDREPRTRPSGPGAGAPGPADGPPGRDDGAGVRRAGPPGPGDGPQALAPSEVRRVATGPPEPAETLVVTAEVVPDEREAPVAAPAPGAALAVGGPASGEAGDAGEVGEDAGGGDPAGRVLRGRDAVLGAVERDLGRKLKRVLADEQNQVLDTLRRGGTIEFDEALPPADEHADRFAIAATANLDGAALLGAALVGAEKAPSCDELAGELGVALADPLRARIRRSFADCDDDLDEVSERVRALYREWKGQHIGVAVRHYTAAAYASGALAAAGDVAVRWLVDPSCDACPDCDDNALAGEVARGEPFPTGHTCSPAHPDCRCLVVPAELLHPG